MPIAQRLSDCVSDHLPQTGTFGVVRHRDSGCSAVSARAALQPIL